MKPTNQTMFDNWLRSVIDRHREHMIEMIGEYSTVWVSESEYEIEASGNVYYSYDPGDYWTPPYSDLESYDIDGKLTLYRADGDLFEVEFTLNSGQKETQIKYTLK